ncbi:hypothetical protein [Foetidibacter luteolus]|uniref:hypothetical protein n=1 Tax=Foetidibacter luteolus TaxID=2608880 RepID=UPI00129A9E5B|nr:hypothetical protein [Foetidibacter luteolus]
MKLQKSWKEDGGIGFNVTDPHRILPVILYLPFSTHLVMRLIKQAVLFFREGNADKVYELSLCDAGAGRYVVNFRYGRRGSVLKEGTKTAVPVLLAEAEKIYDAVETEKLTKGYTTDESGRSQVVTPKGFELDHIQMPDTAEWAAMPPSREKAILLRLNHAVNGGSNPSKKAWKLSRIIWKAGEYQIKEAIPYIARLFNTGDAMQRYCCVWALARCRQQQAIPVLTSIYDNSNVPMLSGIAGVGLLLVLDGAEKEKLVNKYTNSLPEDFKATVLNQSVTDFHSLLTGRLAQQQVSYKWLETLFVLSIDKKWMRPFLKSALEELPLKPGYFKHIRHIFKLAELVDDFETIGLLSCRMERETEMFTHFLTAKQAANKKTHVPETDDFINLVKEFKKQESRIAYSNKTRWYFHGRTRRRLEMMGKAGNTDYVRLATGILIAYRFNKDFKPHYSTNQYNWNGRNYENTETRYLQNAHALYLHQLLSAWHPGIQLSGRSWHMRIEQVKHPAVSATIKTAGGLLNRIKSFFAKKNTPEKSQQQPVADKPQPDKNGTPYLHLWNSMPEAYVQLLMQAEMSEIHQFAKENLTVHPQYAAIKEKLDDNACISLLLSAFAIPAEMGYSITLEKYDNATPSASLAMAMLNSIHEPAQLTGWKWVDANTATYLQQPEFILGLLFARHAIVRQRVKTWLPNAGISTTTKQAVAGKTIAWLLGLSASQAPGSEILEDGAAAAFALLGNELQEVNTMVIADLLQHPVPGVLLFGLQLLTANQQFINLNELPSSFISGLLNHAHQRVRHAGIILLDSMQEQAALQHSDVLIQACLSVHLDVRKALPPLVERLAQHHKVFGDKAAELLLPYLLRKETSEGLHADVSSLLCNQLSNHLQNANKTTALNLVYSTFAAAQNVGVTILEKYTQPGQLTIPQVIALGNHENLTVREWCWRFYEQQEARIKYEKEAAIQLLDSRWHDTRVFAMQYFRSNFSETDWNPETLVALADSIKPDVEAFGRELITRYFTDDNGLFYLLRLSQHPGEKMQLFASNYVERFAAGDIDKIQQLEFYFRSVLTRVNKSRVAKNRIYHFLLTEGRKTESAAVAVSNILSDISATAAIGDKAKCIEILLQLKSLYNVATPLHIKETEMR